MTIADFRLRRPFIIALLSGLTGLSACDSGPKTYDDCMLQASRKSDSQRQFMVMAERCKEQFRNKK